MRLRTLLLATTAAAAVATPAQAAIQTPSKFIGTITATQETTWQEPRHTTFVDCFHRGWVEEQAPRPGA